MTEIKTNIICRDCGEYMTYKDVQYYRSICGEFQKVGGELEACCRGCLSDRVNFDSFDAEDFIAEFCG